MRRVPPRAADQHDLSGDHTEQQRLAHEEEKPEPDRNRREPHPERYRDEIAGRVVPSAIAGQSFYGLNSGAKRSLDRNYLPMAAATGRV